MHVSPDEMGVRRNTKRLVEAYQALIAAGRLEEWIELWAEDGVLEFPFAPKERRRAYHGRAEILAYMKSAVGKFAIDGFERVKDYQMQDPEIAVIEAMIRGRTSLGRPYNQSYVIFFETENGRLKHYREYWNPLVSIEAFGDSWATAFGSPEPEAAS